MSIKTLTIPKISVNKNKLKEINIYKYIIL